MRFGVDFGTTRTVAAVVDRGNYPVVPVVDPAGDSHDYLPSVVALDGAGGLLTGWEAVFSESTAQARSFKRLLGGEHTPEQTPVRIGSTTRPLGEVLAAFAADVVATLRAHQRLAGEPEDAAPEIMLGVPAHAGSAQRLLTIDAFARAGAEVIGLVNEPSAAAFEYTHRHGTTLNSRRSSVIVYDLGGGTFDATLLRIDGRVHHVEHSLGVNRLGGDDFDEALLGRALEIAGRDGDAMGRRVRTRLLEEARTAKEQIKPQTRRIVLDLGEGDDEDVAVVPVKDFYARATPLVERTLEVLAPIVGTDETLTDTDIAGVYLVGGASALPLVPRMLRERFGRRVHRSPLPTASTAVGLGIAADPDSDYALRDRMARGIGVFRETDAGRAVSFDPLVAPGLEADEDGFVRVTRRYRAAHNVGVFRYVEYSALDAEHGAPGDLSLLAEVTVPFDPALSGADAAQLAQVRVERRADGPGPLVEETVTVDPDGIATVCIAVEGVDGVVEATVGR